MSGADLSVPESDLSARRRCLFYERADQYQRYCTTLAIGSNKNRKLIQVPMLGVPGNLIYAGSKKNLFNGVCDDAHCHTFLSRASSCRPEM